MPRFTPSLKVIGITVGTLAFLNSFLMFFIQPMVAKALLPSFGGSAAVWTTVMLFFQTSLVVGYGITHWLRQLSGKSLIIFYGVLLTAALVGCRLHALFSTGASGSPTWAVLSALIMTIGVPFLLLSATTPLLQMVVYRYDSREPYWLYGVSNLASFIALLCYPLAVEPYLKLSGQTLLWTVGFYTLAVGLFLVVVFLSSAAEEKSAVKQDKTEVKCWNVGWFIYPMLASVAFISFTAHLTADVAPVPMLWVLPLSVYLLTFVMVFAKSPQYWIRWTPFLCLVACMIQALPQLGWGGAKVMVALPVALLCLFVLCWFCHGKLIVLRPDPAGLTRFYLALSIGGAAGGFFCGVVAPLIFPDAFEMPLVLLVVGVLAFYEVLFSKQAIVITGGFRILWKAVPFSLVGMLLMCGGLWFTERQKGVLEQERNFYGSVRIREGEGYREMVHGRIVHGVQIMSPNLETTPTAYYYEESAIATVINSQRSRVPGHRLNIGAIGLGVGTVASYFESQDEVVFIELDEKIEQLARTYFTFLEESAADVRVEIGDGRKRLDLFQNSSLDILLVDAFTGDSVPAHLLTSEAFDSYAEKLNMGGILIFHISNNHLDLDRLMAGLAMEKQWRLKIVHTPDKKPYGGASQYAVFIREGSQFPEFSSRSAVFSGQEIERPVLWSDQQNNLFQIIKW